MVSEETFCYIDFAMKMFAGVASSPQWSTALMAVIIGSLCFSVGEGLRLTPFPVSIPQQIQETSDLAPANDAGSTSLGKFGPLDVPSQVQKRSKRQTTDFAFQPSTGQDPFVAVSWLHLADESIQLSSSLFVAPSAGRAPPPLVS